MKMIYPILFCASMIVSSCSDSTPDCLSDQITIFQNNQADCEGASIKKYMFQDQVVYGFSDGICISDGGTTLFDEDCNDFCFVGGIAALTDCNGVNFFENAEELEVIWVKK